MPSPRRIIPLILLVAAVALFAGCTEDPTDVSKSTLQKTEPTPAPAPWLTTIGGTGHDESHDVAVDPAGNAYVVGSLNGPAEIGGQIFDPAGAPVFLAKFDPTGRLLWVKSLAGAGADGPLRLGTDNSGGVIVQGIFITTLVIDGQSIKSPGGADHVFVAKLDGAGNLLWLSYDTAPYLSVGFGMATGRAGNTAVTGFYKAGAEFGVNELAVSGFDFFIAEFDAAGEAAWAWGTGLDNRAIGGAVAVDRSNNVVVAGEFWETVTFGSTELTSAGNRDAFLAKFDAAGDVLWAIRMGEEFDDTAHGVVTDDAGNIYLSGRRWGSPVALWKYTPDGDKVWEVEAPQAGEIELDAANNIFLSGGFRGTMTVGTSELISNGYTDFFVAKFDASGNGLWAVSGGASSDDTAHGLAVDHTGAPIAVVDFRESFEFAGETITSAGKQDLLVFRLDVE